MATRLTVEQKRERLLQELKDLEAQAEAKKISEHKALAEELTQAEDSLKELDSKEQAEHAAITARFTARKDKLNVRILEIQEILAKKIGPSPADAGV